MLILQRKTGSGIPSPPLTSPSLVSDPSVNDDFQPNDIRFAPDGLTVYVVGYKTPSIDRSYVYQYDLSIAWDITTMTYSGKLFQSTSQDDNMASIEIKPDGLSMYLGGRETFATEAYQYDVSTAWDVSSASYSGKKSGDVNPTVSTTFHVDGMYFKPDDGSKMYLCGAHSAGEINEYDLGTNWDISTQSFNAASTNVNSPYPTALFFKTTGDWAYIVDVNNKTVAQHGLVVPWSISTTAAALSTVDISGTTSSPRGLAFSASGHRMYIADATLQKIIQYTLGTDWMISTTNLS